MRSVPKLVHKYYRLPLSLVFLLAAFFLWPYLVYVILVMEVAQIFFGRIYCGFACPYGILQSAFAYVGKRLFPKQFGKLITRRQHEILSCLRYLNIIVMLFFASSILGQIFANIYAPDPHILRATTLNKVALGWLLFWALTGLIIERPYCKYICHTSPIAGAFSHLKLVKIVRDPEICINCKRCEHNCPMSVPITEMEHVAAHNCLSCYKCFDYGVCPKAGALTLQWRPDAAAAKQQVLEVRTHD